MLRGYKSLKVPYRGFSVCATLRQVDSVSSSVAFLKGLDDKKAEIEPPVVSYVGKKKPPKFQDILVLNDRQAGLRKKVPEFFKEKRQPQMLNMLEFEEKRKQLLVFKSDLPLDVMIGSIGDIKPETSIVSLKRYNQIVEDLDKGYSKAQLRAYILANIDTHNRYSGYTKSKMTSMIINQIWKLSKSDQINGIDDLLVQKTIDLSKKEIFLLLSQNGKIIHDLMRKDVKVILIADENQLVVRGTEKSVNYVSIALSNILNKVHSEILDLSEIEKLFKAKGGKELDIIPFQKMTEVFFEKLDAGSKYSLNSLGSKKIDRLKRLLMWSLDSNSHIKEELYLPNFNSSENNDLVLTNYSVDEALPWIHRRSDWFKLTKPVFKPKSEVKDAFSKQLEKFDIRNLNKSQTFDEFKSFRASQAIKDIENTSEVLGLEHDELDEDISINIDSEAVSQVKTYNIDKDQIFDSLTNYDLDSQTKGTARSKWSKPILTASFGDILFEADTHDGIKDILRKPPSLETLKETNKPFIFNSDIPYIGERILSLPLYEITDDPETGSEVLADFNSKTGIDFKTDKHNYFIQLKFLPSPYTSIDNFKEYPPLEMWIRLDEFNKPELDSLEVVTAEVENNAYVTLPGSKTDLRLTSSITGKLIDNEIGEEEGEISSLSDWLADQPGVKDFLKEARLNFDGTSPVHIPKTLSVNIGRTKVEYYHVNIYYRRQLDLLFNNRLLQFTVVEGGTIGGRKYEINLIGDQGKDFNRESFGLLVDDSIKFIEGL